MTSRDFGSELIGDWMRESMERQGLTVKDVAARIAALRREPYSEHVRAQLYKIKNNTRAAGLRLQGEISQALGEPLVVERARGETVQPSWLPRGTIDRNGVFSADQHNSGVGVGSYTVEAIDELDVQPGEVAVFSPASAADMQPGAWVSVRVDGRVQLYEVAGGDGALMLRQPRRKALMTYVPEEHVVIGVYVGALRPAR